MEISCPICKKTFPWQKPQSTLVAKFAPTNEFSVECPNCHNQLKIGK